MSNDALGSGGGCSNAPQGLTTASPPPQALLNEIERLKLEYQQIEKRIKELQPVVELEKVRQHGIEDLYFFATECLGFPDLDAEFHYPICKYLTSEQLRKLLLVARGHFKTTLTSVAKPLWHLVRNQDERIWLVGVTGGLAEICLSSIRGLINSQRFQALYGDRVPTTDRWLYFRQDEALLKLRTGKIGPTFYASGVDASETGRHYSRIIGDDLIDAEKTDSREQNEKAWDWLGRQEAVLDPGGEFCVCGTRWGWDDVYCRLSKFPEWNPTYIRSVYREDGKTPWLPKRFPAAHLEYVKKAEGDYRFSCFYLNNPTGMGLNPFNVNLIPKVEYPERDPHSWRFILVDPATTKRDWSCPTGIIIGDALSSRKFVVAEVILQKMAPDELINCLEQLMIKERPHCMVIEAEASQNTIVSWLEERLRNREEPITGRISSVVNSHVLKNRERILELQPYLHEGRIVFRHDAPGLSDLIEELVTYDKGPHIDLLCALVFVINKVYYPPAVEKTPELKGRKPTRLDQIIQRRLSNRGRRRGLPRWALRRAV